MTEPSRQYSVSGYRYGFNGKEQDPETYGQGNIYDYGFRIYNPRLGRFLSVDPLTQKYPWYSPYQFAGYMTTKYVDLDGLEPTETNNPELKKRRPEWWYSVMFINIPYRLTGGDDKFFRRVETDNPVNGYYSPLVDKDKFFGNGNKNDPYKRYANENSQFLLTNENSYKTEKNLVNELLGNFVW